MDKVFRILAPLVIVAGILVYVSRKYHVNLPGTHLGHSSLLSSNDQAMRKKLGPFIRCINGTDSNLAKVTRSYHQMVAALKSNPNADDLHSTFDFEMENGFNEFSHGDEPALNCANGLEKASAMPPKVTDLDTVGPDYAATLRKLLPIVNKADLYYEQKDYKDDRMARGSELDSQISPLLDHLLQLSPVMRTGVRRENKIVEQHELDAIEARNGKNLRWQTLNFMIQARVTYDQLAQLVGSGKLDLANMEQAMQPAQSAFEAATAYAAAHAEEIKKLDDEGNETVWSGIAGAASNYITELKDVRRELQNPSTPDAVKRQIKAAKRAFDEVIDTYNAYIKADE